MFKIIKINILYFLIIFSIFSCKNKSLIKWEVLDSNITNLKSQEEDFNEIIVGDESLYLLGCDSKMDMNKDVAIVYKSNIRKKRWEEIYKDKGNVLNGYYLFGELFLFRENYYDNSYDKTTLNLINAEKHKVEHHFNERTSIQDVFIDCKGKGAMVLNNSFLAADNSIFFTNNNFNSFDSISFKKSVKISKYFDGNIYLLTDDYFVEDYETIEKNKLFILNKKSLDSIETKDVVEDFCVDKKGIYLLSKVNEKIIINHIDKKRKLSETLVVVNEKELKPEKIYKYDNFVAVLVNSINDNALGGFGSTVYALYISFDNGKTFKEEKLPIDNYVKPIEFYKDELIIYYAGVGRVCRGIIKLN